MDAGTSRAFFENMGHYNLAKDYLLGFEKLNCVYCGKAFKENDPVYFDDFANGKAVHYACQWKRVEEEKAPSPENA